MTKLKTVLSICFLLTLSSNAFAQDAQQLAPAEETASMEDPTSMEQGGAPRPPRAVLQEERQRLLAAQNEMLDQFLENIPEGGADTFRAYIARFFDPKNAPEEVSLKDAQEYMDEQRHAMMHLLRLRFRDNIPPGVKPPTWAPVLTTIDFLGELDEKKKSVNRSAANRDEINTIE